MPTDTQENKPTSQNEPGDTEVPLSGRGVLASINEPPGSTIGSDMPPPEGELLLSTLTPASVVMGTGTFALTVTGAGFTEESVIVFDDEDMDTTFVSETELTAAAVPKSATATTVDVEVARGEWLSDALTFEFTAAAGRGAARPPARKPSKGTRDKSKAKPKKR